MSGVLERLQTLRVRDVMSTSMVTIDHSESLGSAASTMVKGPISGLPVVDDVGRCVGMLTAFDFVRRYAAERDEERAALDGDEYQLVRGSRDEPLEVDSAHPETVAGNMSSGVQSIAQDAPLLDAAREMCAAHIHRLPVLDAHGNVEGIITSLDIVAAIVNAADEQLQKRKKQ